MAGRLLGRLRSKDPAQLVQQCHQAFLKMPFEANPERVGEEVSRLLHQMKVGAVLGCWGPAGFVQCVAQSTDVRCRPVTAGNQSSL